MTDKHTKEEVNFGKGMARSHCGKLWRDDHNYCKHFIGAKESTTSGACEVVQGSIERVKWCELFAIAGGK